MKLDALHRVWAEIRFHFTEHRRSGKKDTPHGPNFWRIYSALVAKAIEMGLYNDNYIDKIILQEDEERERFEKDYALSQGADKVYGIAYFSRLR